MIQAGEDLTLQPESFPEQIGGQGEINEFDGDLLLEIAVGAMSRIHGTHAATAYQPIDLVGPDALSFFSAVSIPGQCLQSHGGHHLFLGACAQKRRDFCDKLGISLATQFDQLRPVAFRQGERLVENCFDLLQLFRRKAHGDQRMARDEVASMKKAGKGNKVTQS
jgi:hypothetical protein